MPVQMMSYYGQIPTDPTKRIIVDGEAFEQFVRFLSDKRKLVFDYETSGTAWFAHAEACGVALASWDDNGILQNAYVPFRHRTGERQLAIERIGPAIETLLRNPRITKIAHNEKFWPAMLKRL